MSEHPHRTIVRHCDVAIVGGSAAGLAAALQLGRQLRTVIVVDSGEPRNAPAGHMHGYLGHEGIAPSELTAIGREEVRSYGGEVLSGRVVNVHREPDGRLRLDLVGGHTIVARRILVATGIVDELPDIDGLAQHWGGDVIHCPFCHGFEARDQRIVQIVTHPMGLYPAPLFRQLSSQFTLVVHGGAVDPNDPGIDALRRSGVPVIAATVTRIVDGDNGRIVAIELANGERLDADAVAIGTTFTARIAPFESIGLLAGQHPSGLGTVVVIDSTGATSVAGVYAAGNVTDPSQQVLAAAAQGSWIGAMISFDLAKDDMGTGARGSGNEADWDSRYSGEQFWSGNPNGALVHEVDAFSTGTVLDIGAGEGGDAIWLAERGWTVTATDISQRALDRVGAAADERGVHIECLRADANSLDPYRLRAFDLVSAFYASILRTPDDRGVRNVLDAVAPGGTLLVVSHDLEPMRVAINTHEQSRIFDPDAYERVDDFIALLSVSPEWEIEVHEKRSRPPGAASASHHLDDIVLRARRRPS